MSKKNYSVYRTCLIILLDGRRNEFRSGCHNPLPPGIVIPELQLSFNVLGESRHDESNAMLLGFIVRFIYLENPFINS